MARPRKNVLGNETAVDTNNEVEKKDETALLREQIEKLQEQLVALSKKASKIETQDDTDDEKDLEAIRIAPDEYIKVMSLCPYQVNLTTQPRGQGRVYRFKEFGEVKRILYSDLVDIIEVHQSFVEQGLLYVLDKRVIRRHGLDDIYSKILPKTKIEEILTGSVNEAVALYRSANDTQRGFIIDMIVARVRDDKNIDFNLISNLSRVSKVDILAKAEAAKQYMSDGEEKEEEQE